MSYPKLPLLFPGAVQGFDAFYVNWGIDDTIAEYLQALNMDQIEGITNTPEACSEGIRIS